MKIKKIILPVLSMFAITGLASCNEATPEVTVTPEINVENPTPDVTVNPNINVTPEVTVINPTSEEQELKYVFMFIGDGMSYPQIQSAAYYKSAMKTGIDMGNKKDVILYGEESLSFMNFSSTGSARTYDATSFAPDSASTATSLATGEKTWSGSINVSTSFNEEYETIAEKLKEQKDFKVGIITSVNLNHATPAAFYAHQKSRNSYDAISDELIESGFDYFAGGKLLGNADEKYAAAEAAGYTVCDTQEEALALTPGTKAIVRAETLADGNAMSYAMDTQEGEWELKDYVSQGIEMLDNETGFFMMCEGGKIDWACHANDAAASIHDTIALSDAVNEAIKFYNEHKEETLIIVTGDHETGGLSIGYAGTDYNTYMTNLSNQKISYAKYDSEYVSKYKANNTSFEDVLKDVKELFGLVAQTDADVQSTRTQLILTDAEYAKLEEAYNQTMGTSTSNLSATDKKLLYGGYQPLSVTLTHILNNKSGISFTSYAHTGLPTAVFAEGNGAELFEGYYDNTNIYDNMASLLGVC